MATPNLRWCFCLLAVAIAGTLPACGTSDKSVAAGGPLSGRLTENLPVITIPAQ